MNEIEEIVSRAVEWYEQAAKDEGWENPPQWVRDAYSYFVVNQSTRHALSMKEEAES